MHALPPDLAVADAPRVTGVTCPVCAGVLQVEREGHGNLRFVCRVGHALSVDELLVAKEEKIEDDLWANVRGLEELIALLSDLELHARRDGRARHQIGGPHDRRIGQAREHVRRLRAILAENRPVDLTRAGDAGG
jgi:two-component system chemotaxis response regulator CheB